MHPRHKYNFNYVYIDRLQSHYAALHLTRRLEKQN